MGKANSCFFSNSSFCKKGQKIINLSLYFPMPPENLGSFEDKIRGLEAAVEGFQDSLLTLQMGEENSER